MQHRVLALVGMSQENTGTRAGHDTWRLHVDAAGFCFTIADAEQAHNARVVFRRYLDTHTTVDSDRDAAELIFGELVANVARHAPGPLEARLIWSDEGALLEIWSPGSAEGSRTRSTTRTTGCASASRCAGELQGQGRDNPVYTRVGDYSR